MRLWLLLLLGACSPGTQLVYDETANLEDPTHFFDAPFPSDARLDAAGHPDLKGFPNPFASDLVANLLPSAQERDHWPVLPVAYFKFTGPLSAHTLDDLIPKDASQPVLLIDIDPASPDRGTLIPTLAQTGVTDDYIPPNVVAIAPRPGFVLVGKRQYAFVMMRSFKDAAGSPLGNNATIDKQANAGGPLWDTLKTLGIDAKNVVAATTFTTGDVVQETADLSAALVAKYPLTIDNLMIDSDNGAGHTGYCALQGTITYPQFQTGTQPFGTGGLFDFSDGGLPAKQGEMTVPLRITIPFATMPDAGWPLAVYFHGSGGVSSALVDRGPIVTVGGDFTPGEGPAFVWAPHGIAGAGSALPLNPERLPGASDTAYLNFNNLAAFRDTFRQGVIEQRMFIEALRNVKLDPALFSACPSVQLPATQTKHFFNPDQLLAQGQSMGGMYTNLVSAVEPRIKAAVPTGAGGYWSYFILQTTLVNDAPTLLGVLFHTDPPTFVHPYLYLFEAASEPAEPIVYMPRVARRPLPSYTARPIYEPVGSHDSYFPTTVYDAVALAYGHNQAGDQVWDTMQPTLALQGFDGILPYPISNNRPGYTGVVVQYPDDPISMDGHTIYAQLPEVKYQYGCFFETFLKYGIATVPAPAAIGTPCPH
jgi:hypothetical protein